MISISDVVKRPEYNFINTDPRLQNNIIYLVYGGSHAYGTSTPSSDIDIRGCVFNSKSDLLGLSSFEQFTNSETDTTIYSFNKLIQLLINCNPNTIEELGCKPEHYLILNNVGQQLINNHKMFLSKRAIYSFGGYANQQLRRLEAALARDVYPQEQQERHILTSCMSVMMNFEERYKKIPEGSISLNIDKSDRDDMIDEIYMDVKLEHYPLRDYKNIWNDLNTVVKEYGKMHHRNNKKDRNHLSKHAMHLIRLYLMCLDILEKEEIITYRENDLSLLMAIRNGEYQNDDNSFRKEFYDLLNELEKKLEYAKINTNLPKQPNYKTIEEFKIYVNEKVVKN